MAVHDQSYALGHIVTARFWHDIRLYDLHFTLSDTGWAKSAWGKFYGQWIEGAAIFVYDIRSKFNPTEIPPSYREIWYNNVLLSSYNLSDAYSC